MPTVTIPKNEMTKFDLPPVCIVTGATDGVVFKPRQFQWYPRWIAIFACSPPLFLIIALVLMKRASGELPFTEKAFADLRKGQLIMAASLVFTLLGLFAMAATVDTAGLAALLFFALGIAAPIAAFVLFVKGRGPMVKRIDDQVIELDIPSEVAARAIEERLHGGAKSADLAGAPGPDALDRKLDDELRKL